MRIRKFYLLSALLITAVFSQAASAWRIPMYQTYNSTYHDYFYTTDASQRALALSYGYVDYGIAFYVDDGATPGIVPLYRFYKDPPQTDHFYTSDLSEVSFVQSYGWVFERYEGYVFNYQAAGTTPIYRLAYWYPSTSDLMHFYTPDYSFAIALTQQGWSLDSTVFYAYTTPDIPPPTPIMVHATHLTASCADKYCVRITGYNFAENSYVEMRQTSANGPVIGYVYDFVRGTSGDAQTIEITFAPGSPYRGQIDHPDGIWFYVVNPGNPPTRGGGFNVIRDSGYSLRGWVESADQTETTGWMCSDYNNYAPVQYKLREGSDSGEIVASGVADGGPRGDVANVCGGTAMHSFQIFWPSKWRDGVARHAYLVGNFAPGSFYRYPNALIPNSPTLVQLAYDPWDSIASPSVQTVNVAPGDFFQATFAFTNKGSAVWDTNTSVLLTDPSINWMPGSLGFGGDIQPDGTKSFTISGGRAPSTAGRYTVQYRVSHAGTFFGQTAFINVDVHP